MVSVREMKIGVVGAGVMGRGIAKVCARSGLQVRITDTHEEAYQETFGLLPVRIGKGLVIPTRYLRLFDDVDFIIEAIAEDLEAKRRVFEALDAICPPHVIFATNTSSIPIRKIAQAVGEDRRKKMVGMHFMNPPTKVPLLELVASRYTSKGTLRTTRSLARLLERDPIILSKDVCGFVVNRVLMAAINEAAHLVQEGIASPKDIDAAVILGVGSTRGMGILKLSDLIGLDVCCAVLTQIATEDLFFTPARILQRMIEEGKLGRKTGEGFFVYEGQKSALQYDTLDQKNSSAMQGGK